MSHRFDLTHTHESDPVKTILHGFSIEILDENGDAIIDDLSTYDFKVVETIHSPGWTSLDFDKPLPDSLVDHLEEIGMDKYDLLKECVKTFEEA